MALQLPLTWKPTRHMAKLSDMLSRGFPQGGCISKSVRRHLYKHVVKEIFNPESLAICSPPPPPPPHPSNYPGDVTYPEVAVVAPAEFVYTPSYCEFVFPHLGGNRERNVGVLVTRRFTKDHPHTVLRLTWEGNLRKRRCVNCCTRWWLEVDGSPCDSDASIETSIRSNSAQDVFAPTSISGFCASSGNLPISEGEHSIRLVNGNCPGSRIVDAGSGFFSTSRLIVEEIPRREFVI